MEAFSEHEYLFGGLRSRDLSGSSIKVAVTSTSTAGSPVVLANYNRICEGKCKFMRPSDFLSRNVDISSIVPVSAAREA
jgi:hypothetical protein